METPIRILTSDEIQLVVDTLERAERDSLHAYQDALFQLRREVRDGEDPALEQWVSFLAQLYLVPLAAMDNLGVPKNTSWIDPKTLTPDQITLIKSLADRITKPGAKVRLCEYLWLHHRITPAPARQSLRT